ncbi:MAG: flagellar protein FlgN [Xanthomonadaceae bacterium]|nr:flagellar protein FlgN [Xanthomonadaceae bacterium]
MDSTVCREHLEKLLIEEAGVLERLQSALDREHELLIANDVDALERAGEERQTCIGDLLRIEEERRSMCRMMNLPADITGLERLLGWCDTSGELKQRWADCADRAGRCRASNDRNGALVAARMKKVEGMLDVLTGRASEPKTYGKQGAYESSSTGARVHVSV